MSRPIAAGGAGCKTAGLTTWACMRQLQKFLLGSSQTTSTTITLSSMRDTVCAGHCMLGALSMSTNGAKDSHARAMSGVLWCGGACSACGAPDRTPVGPAAWVK